MREELKYMKKKKNKMQGGAGSKLGGAVIKMEQIGLKREKKRMGQRI